MKANLLTGTHCFSARTHIGISISAVAKLTQINRNTLSDFEKEKGTITLMQKRALIAFYEERGYDFDDAESPDLDVVVGNYEEAQEQAEHLIDTLPSEVTSTLELLKDSFNDLVTAHNYVTLIKQPQDRQEPEPQGGFFYVDETMGSTLFVEFEEGNKALLEHFERDSKGDTKSEIRFLTSKTNRAASLTAMLAIQTLRAFALHQNNAYVQAVLSGEIDSDVLGIDGARLIEVIDECLERGDALELAGFTSLGINEEEDD